MGQALACPVHNKLNSIHLLLEFAVFTLARPDERAHVAGLHAGCG
mgnify:CR=1 FL=1